MEPDEYTRMDEVELRMWWYRALHTRLLAALTDRLDEAQARDWIVALARQGRYLRDVY